MVNKRQALNPPEKAGPSLHSLDHAPRYNLRKQAISDISRTTTRRKVRASNPLPVDSLPTNPRQINPLPINHRPNHLPQTVPLEQSTSRQPHSSSRNESWRPITPVFALPPRDTSLHGPSSIAPSIMLPRGMSYYFHNCSGYWFSMGR